MDLSVKELAEFLTKKEPFNCEFSFQFELAWWLKYNKKISKLLFEDKKCYEQIGLKEGHRTPRCDLVLYDDNNNPTTLIELKYIIKKEGRPTTSVEARKSFVKDFSRLRECVDKNNKLNAYCIFLTDWDSIFNKDFKQNENDVLKDFKNYFTKNWQDCFWNNGSKIKILIANVKDRQYSKIMSYSEVMQKYNHGVIK